MENYDITAPCTGCGGPRPCPCELLLYQEYMKKDKPAASKKSKKSEIEEGD